MTVTPMTRRASEDATPLQSFRPTYSLKREGNAILALIALRKSDDLAVFSPKEIAPVVRRPKKQ